MNVQKIRDDCNSWLHQHLVYPATVAALGETGIFRRMRELEVMQWWPPERLAAYQRERLASLLDYARERTSFYRAQSGRDTAVSPDDAFETLARMPLLTKADLQTRGDELHAVPPPRRVSAKTTGGSSGRPVTVHKDRRATAYERAAMWLGYGWNGVRIGDRVARFWGSPHAGKRRLLTHATDFAMNRIRFSAFAFDEADLERYWHGCVRFAPAYFHGYVSMLEAFARHVEARGHDGRSLGLKSIIATSEVLSPPQRELLERTFGAPVQSEYGCGELGPIAYECERGTLHLMAPDVIVELLRPDGTPAAPGEAAEVVVTDLNNRAMPLIRYRIGDNAIGGTERCACGRVLPVLQKIWGRAYDFVQTADGRRYHGEFFMYLFEDLRRAGVEIRGFQVLQPVPGALEIALDAPADGSDAIEAHVAALLAERLDGVELTLQRVDAIPRAPSGKAQVVRNLWAHRRTATSRRTLDDRRRAPAGHGGQPRSDEPRRIGERRAGRPDDPSAKSA